ncbi:hypothetical protein, partial, partial [Absidia glauca]
DVDLENPAPHKSDQRQALIRQRLRDCYQLSPAVPPLACCTSHYPASSMDPKYQLPRQVLCVSFLSAPIPEFCMPLEEGRGSRPHQCGRSNIGPTQYLRQPAPIQRPAQSTHRSDQCSGPITHWSQLGSPLLDGTSSIFSQVGKGSPPPALS